jgi:hypothetical protein
MRPSWLPTKTCKNSLGLAAAVAIMNCGHCTVGIVEMAPFESEYGSGQSLIIIKSLMPSCFNVRASAAKRLSFSVSRVTYDLRSVRDTRNEAVLPMMVPEATMSHLPCS